ncbi:hypothetical protein [Microlunatus sp. GCM10028923]|uniref:hypothetical protein n=1 Tax=Microlunatus sp. GCM10028923 TaxID=3273400 RepID=UPI003613213C
MIMTRRLALALGLVAVLAALAQVAVQRTFAEVRHPVSLGQANTTADPGIVRGWYRQLREQDTFGWMVATELVDCLWVAAVASFVLLGTLLLSRLVSRRNPAAACLLRRAAPWVALAPALDLLENGLSLAMLADPAGFADWLAVAHAAVSRVKLGAMIAVGVAVPGFALVAYVLGGGGRDDGEGAVPPRLAARNPDRRRG